MHQFQPFRRDFVLRFPLHHTRWLIDIIDEHETHTDQNLIDRGMLLTQAITQDLSSAWNFSPIDSASINRPPNDPTRRSNPQPHTAAMNDPQTRHQLRRLSQWQNRQVAQVHRGSYVHDPCYKMTRYQRDDRINDRRSSSMALVVDAGKRRSWRAIYHVFAGNNIRSGVLLVTISIS